jgi:hypothetical protein
MTVNIPGNYRIEQADRMLAHPSRAKISTGARIPAGVMEKEEASASEQCRGKKLREQSNEDRFCSAVK